MGSPAISPHMKTLDAPFRAPTFGHPADHPDDRRVERMVKIGDMPVAAIDGQKVLYQIIGADAEKIDHGSHGVRHDNG
jgi:hypothetical protein